MIISSDDISSPLENSLSFGVDNDRLAAALHRLADNIAMHRIAVSGVRILSQAHEDNYHMTTLRIHYAEGLVPPPSEEEMIMLKHQNVHVAAYEKSKNA